MVTCFLCVHIVSTWLLENSVYNGLIATIQLVLYLCVDKENVSITIGTDSEFKFAKLYMWNADKVEKKENIFSLYIRLLEQDVEQEWPELSTLQIED